ncbi:MAG: hypothetical protein L0Z70_09770 [Chloroflexi bacterium]|nr:hypothetical protein [Chloroflexota bacterium]
MLVSDSAEEQLVHELAQLGVAYLSRQSEERPAAQRRPEALLAGLVGQRSSRVRAALIALLLAHPEYARFARGALNLLDLRQAGSFRLFYTAAVILQQMYAETIQARLGRGWRVLPDLFSAELGVSGRAPAERLQSLGRIHAQASGEILNWAGTYDHAAQHLFHQWEKEQSWRTSPREP